MVAGSSYMLLKTAYVGTIAARAATPATAAIDRHPRESGRSEGTDVVRFPDQTIPSPMAVAQAASSGPVAAAPAAPSPSRVEPHLAQPDVNPSFTKSIFLGELREDLI